MNINTKPNFLAQLIEEILHSESCNFFFYIYNLYFPLKLHNYQTKLEIMAHKMNNDVLRFWCLQKSWT